MRKHSDEKPTMKLCDATLGGLPDGVLTPSYDRSKLSPGFVHIGLGNFHRAHQAWYLHRLMQQGLALDWAIVGAGVRPYDEDQRLKLAAQDYMTTLIELSPEGRTAEVIGSMIDYVPIEPGNAQLIEQMAQPEIRIVSLTVTEGGYYIDPVTKEFDTTHPDILFDAANPENPKTAFGAIVVALRLRRDREIGPFTGMSCDNLQGNGTILRQTVVSLARMSDPKLAGWIDTTCSFPNSMVDCIVPATGTKERELVQALGIDDALPVTHENFRQWVIEDDFCAGRPDWDKVDVTFTDNVHDFEAMKILVLNGGHQVIAGAGELLTLGTIADCMEHEKVAALFDKVVREEIAPLVKPVLGMTPAAYIALIKQRFSNPHIVDTTRRVAFDGSSRHPGFIIPSIRTGLARDTPVDGLAFVSAVWARMCEGKREDGSRIEPNDPVWHDLQLAAKAARRNPNVWLSQDQYYGDLSTQPRFVSAFDKWLKMIWAVGLEAAMESYLES